MIQHLPDVSNLKCQALHARRTASDFLIEQGARAKIWTVDTLIVAVVAFGLNKLHDTFTASNR